MIKSMTGYGSANGTSGKLEISIELKSVNNRFFDCNIRIPRVYTALEDTIKTVAQGYISRGKMDIFVTVDSSKSDDVVISLNEPLADAYMKALNDIESKYGIKNELTAITFSRIPDVLMVEKKEVDTDALSGDVSEILKKALQAFNEMREKEGRKMYEDITSRLDKLEEMTGVIEARSPETVKEYVQRLEQKMKEVLQNTEIDESRILTEAAIFGDKVAVDEETVRLRSHISQFREILQMDEPIGRKLDFLTQEVNRETNTIGSKCNDAAMARIVVNMKAEIEKIREQIQNIE